MSTGFRPAGNRPPPPTYTEALSYPVESTTTITAFSPTVLPPFNSTNTCIHSESWNFTSSVDEPLYQTIPGESVYLLQPTPVYSNVNQEEFVLKKFTYKITKTATGKPLIYLEAIPENVASSEEEMGVKTYAQLEVVSAGSEREGEIVYGRGGGGVVCKDVQSNGKAVLVPINGTITPDRMIVDALLNDHVVRSECSGGSSSSGSGDTIVECSTNGEHEHVYKMEERLLGTRGRGECEMKHCDHKTRHEQLETDMETFTQALEDEDKCPSLDEDTPLLQVEHETAQIEIKDETRDVKRDRCRTKILVKKENKSDSELGGEECSCLELKDHHMDRSMDHMTDSRDVMDHVIYSEPEYSSSDASISKYGNETPKRNKLDTCQKTLKRTHNGVDHTVFELSPSDSFYNSTDNVHGAEKDPSSVNSSDGLCRLGHSSGSLTDSQTPHGDRQDKHPLSRETSVSFKKPLVEGPSSASRPGGRNNDTKPQESAVMSADSEPLCTSTNKSPSESTEAIATQLIMEDTRTYYRRKAAERGTLYCACGGVVVVATIVFLLIYFS